MAHECHFSRQVQYLGHGRCVCSLRLPHWCGRLGCHLGSFVPCRVTRYLVKLRDEQIGNGIQLSTFETLHCRLLKFTAYMPHSTLQTAQSTLRTLRFNFHTTLWTPHYHFLHSILYPVHSTLYILHSTLCALHSTLYTLDSTLHTLDSTLHTLDFTLHTMHS